MLKLENLMKKKIFVERQILHILSHMWHSDLNLGLEHKKNAHGNVIMESIILYDN